MVETPVREGADGEELVLEGPPREDLQDPRERTIEARRRALDRDDDTPGRSQF